MDSRKFLSDDERTRLELVLRERLDSDTRDAAMILVALHSGARASELLAIGWPDVNLTSGEIYLRTLKGGAPRAVVVPRFLLGALARLRETSPARPFDVSYNRLGEIWRLWRPVEKPFHCLRHSFAMRAYERTKDIRFVRKALGHRSITNTMVYADCDYTAAQFRKLMRVR